MTRYVSMTIVTAVLLTCGCARSYSAKFPYGRSIDRHNFVSTPHLPLTVTLKDTVTGEELLRIDVPVYKQLIIDLEHKKDWNATLTPALPAEYCTWDVVDSGRNIAANIKGQLRNRLDLPGNPVILKVDVREAESATQVASGSYQPVAPSGQAEPTYQPVESTGPATTSGARPATATDTGPVVATKPTRTVSITQKPALDRHEWTSTKAKPLSVAIVNTTNDTNELSLDIPPGKKLVMDLFGQTNSTRATSVSWQIVDASATAPKTLANTKDLSGQPMILRVAQRPSMEDDAGVTPKYTPVTPIPADGSDLQDVLE